MSEKKVKITKGLFCCVRFVCIAMVAVFLFSSMSCTVSAADVNGNEFLDPSSYAKIYSVDDNASILYRYNFPTDWYQTGVFAGPEWSRKIGDYIGRDISFWYTGDSVSLLMKPCGGSNAGIGTTGLLKNAHFVDLTYFPEDSYLTGGFEVKIAGENIEFSADCWVIYYFVNSAGEIVGRKDVRIVPEAYEVYFDYFRCEYTHSFKLSDWPLPDTVVGVLPIYTMKNMVVNDEYEVFINYNPAMLQFKMSSLEMQAQQNLKLQGTMNAVQKSLEEQSQKIDELPDKIGDQMQNVVDQEKQEAESEGNKFVDQILDKLPDPSQGILSALGNLTSAVNYTGTDAALTIPAIVLPGIGNLFPETEIWGGTEFSFGEYVQMLPPGLLLLVQSLFTIAMVLFCVFELKGIISYCLTLREKDGG